MTQLVCETLLVAALPPSPLASDVCARALAVVRALSVLMCAALVGWDCVAWATDSRYAVINLVHRAKRYRPAWVIALDDRMWRTQPTLTYEQCDALDTLCRTAACYFAVIAVAVVFCVY